MRDPSPQISFAVMTDRALPLRVAFGGRMQVGKTTAADHLVARHGFRKMAFADPIKEIAVSAFGWDGRKDPAGRRLLQEIGTAGRNYRSDLWIDRLDERLAAEGAPRVVVDDLRLKREVDALERLGFVCARIVRGQGPDGEPDAARHETEIELETLDLAIIDNSGTFEELFARIDAFLINQKAPP